MTTKNHFDKMTRMDALKIIIGAALFSLGLTFLYRPKTILSLNQIVREFLANDKSVILYHKKIAIILICLSFIALYMGGAAPGLKTRTPAARAALASQTGELMLGAMRDYYDGEHRGSLMKTLRALARRPDEEWAMAHLACVYRMLGENEKAREALNKAAAAYPENKTVRRLAVLMAAESGVSNSKKPPETNLKKMPGANANKSPGAKERKGAK